MTAAERFTRLPTAAKLLLILTAVLLPIGIALAWLGESGIRQADDALEGRADDQSRAAAQAVESLIARNALALRIAANGALASGNNGACIRVTRSLGIAPGVAQNFELETSSGQQVCAVGNVGETGALPLVAPGDVAVRIAPSTSAVAIRVGVINGMATSVVGLNELRTAAAEAGNDVRSFRLRDRERELVVLGTNPDPANLRFAQLPIGKGVVVARAGVNKQRVSTGDRLLLLLPLLMWVAAALLAWWLVSRLLLRPLKRLQRAVIAYRPGEEALELPRRVGPSREIEELRDAFARAVAQAEQAQQETTGALEGQRRLVREVHHRVKNNLQVVASLLNIHGRSAETAEARAAYAGISRRVGALSIVHRNHYAEMEESRGISLRPLLTELGAELRAGAPAEARGLAIDLELDSVYTTQDVAVAVAFLITEIVEFAMLHQGNEPIDIALRRTGELTARLTLCSSILRAEDDDDPEKIQFERIVGGLAKQLRSPLERKLGRYSVDLPVFPPI